MPVKILLLAPEAAGLAAADALAAALDAEVHLQTSMHAGSAALRLREYTLVLLDEALAAMDHEATEHLYRSATVPLLELNFALSSAPRIVRQARAALVRQARDFALAQAAAASLLHGELNRTLAGLLLESELALRQATPEQQPRLRSLVRIAGSLRDQLRIPSQLTN